jgi:hypothetical protein
MVFKIVITLFLFDVSSIFSKLVIKNLKLKEKSKITKNK